MKPISRLRMRVRSESERFATDFPLRTYSPSDGESSKPRIERSVDLPQPDGPLIATYSPRLICRWMLARACVSTSSVRNTFFTLSIEIKISFALAMLGLLSLICPDSFYIYESRPKMFSRHQTFQNK